VRLAKKRRPKGGVLFVADLEAEGLARHRAVALDFLHRRHLILRHIVLEIGDRLLARPSFAWMPVSTTRRTPRHTSAVRRPTHCQGSSYMPISWPGISLYSPSLPKKRCCCRGGRRAIRGFLGQAALEVMARNGLVQEEGVGGEACARLRLVGIEVKDGGAFAVDRAELGQRQVQARELVNPDVRDINVDTDPN
jgi:hypothetical protein